MMNKIIKVVFYNSYNNELKSAIFYDDGQYRRGSREDGIKAVHIMSKTYNIPNLKELENRLYVELFTEEDSFKKEKKILLKVNNILLEKMKQIIKKIFQIHMIKKIKLLESQNKTRKKKKLIILLKKIQKDVLNGSKDLLFSQL